MIELKTYKFSDFCDILKITKNQKERRFDDLLEWLSYFYDYTFIKGKTPAPHLITIHEIYYDYQPLPRKTRVKEIQSFYENKTDTIVKVKPLNSGSNIAREIVATDNKYEHKEGTAACYVRRVLKAKYQVDKRLWCKINYSTNTYEPLTEEDREYLHNCFELYLNSKTADWLGDVEAGLITKEEMHEKMTISYLKALKEFKKVKGYRPYRAGYLESKTVWEIQEAEKQ